MAKRRLLSLIYPTRCPICGDVIFCHEGFCTKCAEHLTPYSGSHLINGADGYFSAFEYNDAIKPAVMLMKDGIGGNAPFAFGTALAEVLKNADISDKIDMIIPVPMYSADVRKRGFNQSELIAKEVGISLNIAVRTDIAVKERETLAQKKLNRQQRELNLLNSFSLTDKMAVNRKNILLLDDVCTTGSTLAELTKLLKNSGAAMVWCASCCKTPDRKDFDKDV